VLAGLEELQGFAVDSGEVDQFNEVDPAFPGFGLGNEGLRAGQSSGDFGLCQTCIQPGLLQPFPKQPVVPNVVFGFQFPPRGLRGSFYYPELGYPKIEYCSMATLRGKISVLSGTVCLALRVRRSNSERYDFRAGHGL
jgi:hypothetical protein